MRRGDVWATAEQFLAVGARAVVALVDAAALQFRYDQFDKILEALGGHGIGEVEPVDAGRLDPKGHLVGHLLGRADKQRAPAADRDMLGPLPHGPDASRL